MFLDVSDDCTSIFSRNEENYFSKNFELFFENFGKFIHFHDFREFGWILHAFDQFSYIFTDFH